jgi:hypothetical protein
MVLCAPGAVAAAIAANKGIKTQIRGGAGVSVSTAARAAATAVAASSLLSDLMMLTLVSGRGCVCRLSPPSFREKLYETLLVDVLAAIFTESGPLDFF